MQKTTVKTVVIVSVSLLLLNLCLCAGNKTRMISGKAFYYQSKILTTLVRCSKEDPCCNECSADLYLISGSDTILLTGELKGKYIHCIGTDCSLDCSPFQIGKEYKLTGKYVSLYKEQIRAFLVTDYIMTEAQVRQGLEKWLK